MLVTQCGVCFHVSVRLCASAVLYRYTSPISHVLSTHITLRATPLDASGDCLAVQPQTRLFLGWRMLLLVWDSLSAHGPSVLRSLVDLASVVVTVQAMVAFLVYLCRYLWSMWFVALSQVHHRMHPHLVRHVYATDDCVGVLDTRGSWIVYLVLSYGDAAIACVVHTTLRSEPLVDILASPPALLRFLIACLQLGMLIDASMRERGGDSVCIGPPTRCGKAVAHALSSVRHHASSVARGNVPFFGLYIVLRWYFAGSPSLLYPILILVLPMWNLMLDRFTSPSKTLRFTSRLVYCRSLWTWCPGLLRPLVTVPVRILWYFAFSLGLFDPVQSPRGLAATYHDSSLHADTELCIATAIVMGRCRDVHNSDSREASSTIATGVSATATIEVESSHSSAISQRVAGIRHRGGSSGSRIGTQQHAHSTTQSSSPSPGSTFQAGDQSHSKPRDTMSMPDDHASASSGGTPHTHTDLPPHYDEVVHGEGSSVVTSSGADISPESSSDELHIAKQMLKFVFGEGTIESLNDPVYVRRMLAVMSFTRGISDDAQFEFSTEGGDQLFALLSVPAPGSGTHKANCDCNGGTPFLAEGSHRINVLRLYCFGSARSSTSRSIQVCMWSLYIRCLTVMVHVGRRTIPEAARDIAAFLPLDDINDVLVVRELHLFLQLAGSDHTRKWTPYSPEHRPESRVGVAVQHAVTALLRCMPRMEPLTDEVTACINWWISIASSAVVLGHAQLRHAASVFAVVLDTSTRAWVLNRSDLDGLLRFIQESGGTTWVERRVRCSWMNVRLAILGMIDDDVVDVYNLVPCEIDNNDDVSNTASKCCVVVVTSHHRLSPSDIPEFLHDGSSTIPVRAHVIGDVLLTQGVRNGVWVDHESYMSLVPHPRALTRKEATVVSYVVEENARKLFAEHAHLSAVVPSTIRYRGSEGWVEEVCIALYVRHKGYRLSGESDFKRHLTCTMGGAITIPVDVREGEFVFMNGEDVCCEHTRPLCSGLSISPEPKFGRGGRSTLTCIARHVYGHVGLVMPYHSWHERPSSKGVVQPAFEDGTNGGIVASMHSRRMTMSKWESVSIDEHNITVDAAFLPLCEEENLGASRTRFPSFTTRCWSRLSADMGRLNYPYNFETGPRRVTPPHVQRPPAVEEASGEAQNHRSADHVFMTGASSGLVCGQLVVGDVSVSKVRQWILFSDELGIGTDRVQLHCQYKVKGLYNVRGPAGQPGDSGALVCRVLPITTKGDIASVWDAEPIGMFIGGIERTGVWVVTPIQAVMQALTVTMVVDDVDTSSRAESSLQP